MKLKKIIFLMFLSIILFFNTVCYAHSVDLDPDNLISFPFFFSNGKVNITVRNSESNYTLYYQAVEIPNSTFSKITTLNDDGKKACDSLKNQLDALDDECDNLEEIYNKATEAYKNDKDDDTLKTNYETVKTNYQNKINEYNTKLKEYNAKIEEVDTEVKNLTPSYIESNWKKTTDDSFSIDLSQFSDKKAFAIWIKLVRSNGEIVYDEGTFTFSGTKSKDINVESIKLNKSSISLIEGESYTLSATISPTDATNKTITWTSSNEKIAKVINGKVSAISAGTTTITATTSDGNYKATCNVTVLKKDSTPSNVNDGKGNEIVQDTGKVTNTSEDFTTAPNNIPQTGDLFYIVILITTLFSISGFIMYKKFRFLNFK